MNDSDDNTWINIRGKKVNKVTRPKIDFSLINKRIFIITEKELDKSIKNKSVLNLPNKYGRWLVK